MTDGGTGREALDLEFEAIFNGLPGIYLVLAANDEFTMLAANDARLAATLSTREATIGRPLFELFPDNPDDPAADGVRNLTASLRRVVETGRSDTMAVQKYDIPIPESDGGGFDVRYWSPMNVPILAADGSVRYIVHRVEDVTEFVNLQERDTAQQQQNQELRERSLQMQQEILARSKELQAANEHLRELDTARTTFFDNISHEFRTPLSLQIGPLEDALADTDRPLPDVQRERVDIAHRNSRRLLRLVNTLLDFSRIEAGRSTATFAPTDLAELTSEIASNFESTFEQAGIDLVIDCPRLPEPVFVDRSMWEKIVLNLVSNAFKFTFSGGVEISLSAGQDCVLEVRDTGIGIPENELDHVFERFHRVQGARGRTFEGSGIGLALVRELVDAHEGTISVSSQEGAGTTFRVTVPFGSAHLPAASMASDDVAPTSSVTRDAFVAEAHEWARSSARVAPAASPSATARIVLADDNADMREYMRRILVPHWEVETVCNGREALDAIRASRPDIVLSDVMMPELDGIGLLGELRSDPELESLPVILLSARAGDDAVSDGLDHGADDYLVKPFSAIELIARVRSHIQRAQAVTELERVAEELRRANELKSSFVAVVSHELRTPLVAIRGFTEVMVDRWTDITDADKERYLGIIHGQARRLGQLVNDTLALSRIEAGALIPGPEPIHLSSLVHDALAELGIEDVEIVDDGADTVVFADPGHVQQIVINFVANARKYGGGDVAVHITPDGDGSTLRVQDGGSGIPEESRAKLFLPFSQLGLSSSEQSGSGLGLSIVAGLAQINGGSVWYEPNEPHGSRFCVTFPAGA